VEVVEPWLDVDAIATHLGVSAITIYRWLESGRIPAHRVGKLWRFKASEVDSWVQDGGAEKLVPVNRKSTKKIVKKGPK
jgi:excisionase family DNA binding protein